MPSRVSLRVLTALVVVLVLGSFVLASFAVAVSLGERNTRIEENTRMAMVNARRSARTCERVREIVTLLDSLVPTVSLDQRLAAIDARYPDVQSCTPKKP